MGHSRQKDFCRLQSFTPHQTLSVAAGEVGKKEKEKQLLTLKISVPLVPQSNVFMSRLI